MLKKIKSIVIGGVGGQGILKMSDILCEAALIEGYDVKKSEVHGMAQRGGSVTSHVRFGEKVYSPLVEPGRADIVVTLEYLEALRYAHFASPEGVIVYDSLKIDPPSVYTGKEKYPDDIQERLENYKAKKIKIDAFKIALELKNPRTHNVVMLGAISPFLPFKDEIIFEAIERILPSKFVEVNIEAFKRGKNLTK